MNLKKFIEKITPHHHHHSHHHNTHLGNEPHSGNCRTKSYFSVSHHQIEQNAHNQNFKPVECVNERNSKKATTQQKSLKNECLTNNQNFCALRENHSKSEVEELKLHHDHNTEHYLRNPNHSEKLIQKLNEMRNSRQMCDAILTVSGAEIVCHKYVLAANSPYFLAMFTNGLLETSKKEVEIKEIEADSLQLLVDYMYSGELVITESNVQHLLSGANLLMLNCVKEACSQFIQSQIDTSNCLGIREYADLYSCTLLQKYSDAFIEQYFSEIVTKEEFLNLSIEQLVNLISRDHLAVSNERVVFNSVLNWLNHESSRRSQIDVLIKHIRLPLIDSNVLIELLECPSVKESSHCVHLIHQAIQYRRNNHSSTYRLKIDCDSRPRVALGLPRIMYIFGGQAPKASNKIEIYDFRLQRWMQAKEMPSKRCRAGCVLLEGLVYLIGGFDGQSRVRSVDIFNPTTDEWSSGGELLCRRATLAVAVLDSKIYAVGGFDGMSGLMSMECYDPLTKAWTMKAYMSMKRSSVGVVSLNNHLYAIGGYCGASRECLDSVEKYDPATDTWRPMASMHMRRSGASVNVLNEKIYVVGGHDGPVVLKSAEYYDSETNKWHLISEMNIARRNAGFVINNGLFYVLGGDDGRHNFSSVEVYNPEVDVWSLLPSFLNEQKSYLSCVIVENFGDE